MERESLIDLELSALSDHYQIGPLIVDARNTWKESNSMFQSIKARQEFIIQKLFPNDFVHRHVIPSHNSETIEKVLFETSLNNNISIGIRTAYADSRLAGAPWIMQNSQETSNEFLTRALSKYEEWMSNKENRNKPEAVIIMENPKGLGEPSLAKNCLVLRLSLIPRELRCIFEGCPWTDQTRDLEETIVKGEDRVKNPAYLLSNNFNGSLSFDISRKRIVPKEIYWEKEFLARADENTKLLLTNTKRHLATKINLSDLLARLIALNLTTFHETIQFQARKSLFTKNSPYFDFFLGYGLRGAEEMNIVEEAINKSRRKIHSWQIPFYE